MPLPKVSYNENLPKALEACKSTASYPLYDGLNYYLKLGYVPEDKSSNSVSKTLEYAYDDWAIAQIALRVGDLSAYDNFMQRSESYRHVFDSVSGLCVRSFLMGISGGFRST